MIVKKLITVIFWSLLVVNTNAQIISTAQLNFDNYEIGAIISLPVYSADISSVYGKIIVATLDFEYDAEVLQYFSYSNLHPAMISEVVDIDINPAGATGILRFSFEHTAFSGFEWPEGKLFDIQFIYLGGSTQVEIQLAEFVTQSFETFLAPVQSSTASITIADVINAVPGTLSIPVNANFSGVQNGVGAITMYIQFDARVLDTPVLMNPALNGFQTSSVTSNLITRLTVSWSDINMPTTLNGKLFDLNFNYKGGNSVLDLMETTSIGDGGANLIPRILTDGNVAQALITPGISINFGEEYTATPGSIVQIPVYGHQLYNIGGIDMDIYLDAAVLSSNIFVVNRNLLMTSSGSWSVNFSASASTIFVVWSKNGVNNFSLPDSTKLFDLQFEFASGNSPISFINQNQIASGEGPFFPPFENAYFTSSSITDGIQVFNLNLQADPNIIGVGLTGAGNYNVGQTVNISTTIPYGYLFAGWSGLDSSLLVDASSPSTSFIMPAYDLTFTANFIQVFSVSGVLKYANTSGPARPITNSTVYLKSADGLTTIATTTTHATTGAYAFENVPAGNYKLTASTTKPWNIIAVTLADYALVRNYVNNNVPNLSGIIYSAANVNNSGGVTLADYGIIRNRVNNPSAPQWAAPDWIFDLLDISIINASLWDVVIRGVISGDVNSSYTFD